MVATTEIYYTFSGTNSFAVNFTSGYIDQSHVKCTVNNVARTLTWINNGLVSIDTTLYTGDSIRIYRDTPKNETIHNFIDGQSLTEQALDQNFLQALLVNQENNVALTQSPSVSGLTLEQANVSDTEFGIDYYRAGSTQRDAVDAVLELATSTVQASQTFTQSGSTTVYAVVFYVLAAVDLQVKVNGTIVTNYTLQNVGRRNGEMTITFASAPANGATVLFERINLTKYVLRKTVGLFSQHDKNVKLNYIDMTSEFTEFARGIRLPINPNTTAIVTSDIADCNGVLRAGALIETTGATTFQRGISLVSKIATGTYQITLDATPPTFKVVQCLPRATSTAIFNTASDVSGNQVTIYTRNQAGNLTDSVFFFGIYY